jgi:hypothetical protein
VLFVLKPNELADGKYIPLVATVEPLGMKRVAVAAPVVAKLVPSNVSAEPVVITPVELAYITPLAVLAVEPVPVVYTDLDAGYVTKTSLVPAVKSNAEG